MYPRQWYRSRHTIPALGALLLISSMAGPAEAYQAPQSQIESAVAGSTSWFPKWVGQVILKTTAEYPIRRTRQVDGGI